jgi:hypothetical protein
MQNVIYAAVEFNHSVSNALSQGRNLDNVNQSNRLPPRQVVRRDISRPLAGGLYAEKFEHGESNDFTIAVSGTKLRAHEPHVFLGALVIERICAVNAKCSAPRSN